MRPNRLRSFSQREADKRRKETAEQRATDKERRARPGDLAADRLRKTAPGIREADRKRKERRAAKKAGGRAHIERASANRQHETTHRGGTWQEAAATIAKVERAEGEHEEEADRAEEEHEEEAPEERAPDLKVMPPSYVGLNDETCLRHIGQMYGFLHEVRWCTCVCCWRAWCHAPLDYAFDKVPSKTGQERQ